MKLYFGGAFQGKLALVKREERLSDDLIAKGAEAFDPAKVKAVEHLEEWVRRELSLGKDPVDELRALYAANPELILIMNEVGQGVLPAEKSEREYAELCGRVLTEAASLSDSVIRVFCGIGTELKNETFSHYIRYGSKRLRCGYTTGSCAALAAKAAAIRLFTGQSPETVTILTPRGIPVKVRPVASGEEGNGCYAAVRKDAGEDPDVTDGMLIFARVEKAIEQPEGTVTICGGEGIGRVTKPGLDQPVGAWAINRIPRQMIEENLREVCTEYDYHGALKVTVYAPEGEALAKKTFNPSLGIEGGISILGTTGIVDPMSEKALIDVIETEARQAAASSHRIILIPGNYAEDFMETQELKFPEVPIIKYSGFLGEALDSVKLEEFSEVLLISHVGKLVKTAGGIMNTHQKIADCRMELFTAHAAICGADTALCKRLMEAATTDACLDILTEAGLMKTVLSSLMGKIRYYLQHRLGEEIRLGVMMFSNVYGLLSQSEGTEELLKEWREKP